jgi:hypothetical protein
VNAPFPHRHSLYLAMDRRSPENREHFRVIYPEDARPRLVWGGRICEVLDCSERGLLFRSVLPPDRGSTVRGRLRSPDVPELWVEGTVVRVLGDRVALRLREPGVPFAEILREHLRLLRNLQR